MLFPHVSQAHFSCLQAESMFPVHCGHYFIIQKWNNELVYLEPLAHYECSVRGPIL